ncbi:unnamed protein product [Protopolystoma xenopodis]|uniref:Uncharacterized protein n=1 Tax=Protopolystoma xenopodis TaxID=117903 RepID=A0A3S5CMA4_9PLAT|nr:unnamed protein product [Protopolystoma xenopodis]
MAAGYEATRATQVVILLLSGASGHCGSPCGFVVDSIDGLRLMDSKQIDFRSALLADRLASCLRPLPARRDSPRPNNHSEAETSIPCRASQPLGGAYSSSPKSSGSCTLWFPNFVLSRSFNGLGLRPPSETAPLRPVHADQASVFRLSLPTRKVTYRQSSSIIHLPRASVQRFSRPVQQTTAVAQSPTPSRPVILFRRLGPLEPLSSGAGA